MKDTEFKNWRKARKQGLLKYSFFNGFLAWGVPMFVIMTFIVNDAFDAKGNLNWAHVKIGIVAWTIGGFLFGFFIWFWSERKFNAELGRRGEIEQKQ